MADGKGDATAAGAGAGAGAEAPAVSGAGAEAESMARGHRPTSPAPGAPGLRPCLWQLETELREQEVSEVSSLNYCRSFCQTLLQYASNKNASEHIVYLLEVYRLAIQSFASARPFLTTECEDVLLVLGRLVLSCFELLLSVPESELPCEVWVPFLQSLQESHDALLEFGNNNLQILVHVTKEGVWKNPVLLKILSQQPVETEEVNKLIAQEGPSFLQMRIKHLLKSNCIPQATALSKLCAESKELSQVSCFQQAYVTCLCSMLPSEEAIQEIAKVDCKEVLDIICNLESEGQDNTAFILCTTYLTQQLQTASVYCSWELTLFWSKLQRRIDPSLETFLERCRQFGVIAKTQQHLFCLIRVIQTEAQDAGIGVSILLCVRALQLRSSEDEEMKASVCKTISCLLPEDLEVRRACQLTEFLIEPSLDGFNMLEELYLQPDQKFDEENAPVPNSLRCELLLALKAHWPFDPEFWDWKTLKRHCHQLLGQEASDSDDDLSGYEMSINDTDVLESFLSDYDEGKEDKHYRRNLADQNKEKRDKKPIGSSERYQRWLQYKFFCLLCKRECIEARILHHSKMHMEDGIYTCPVCIKKFKRKELFVPHVMEHVKMPPSRRERSRKKLLLKGSQRGVYPKSPTRSLEQNQSLSEQAKGESHEYVTFSKLEDCRLQDRDLYPCPGTDCSRVFKQFKYLSVHLKAEHQNNDENAKHYLDMKNRREKCTYCRRHFMSAFHLREHEQVHCGPQPYMCVSIDCYARFGSVNELLNHKQKHDDLRYKCELNGCNIVFSDLGQLYHHEAQHFRDASYTCNVLGCKKFYYSKIEYQDHLSMHNVESPGEELKKSVKLEEPAAGGKQDSVDQPHLLDQIDKSHSPEDLLFCAGSASAHIDTSENLKDNSDSNCSDQLSHSSSTSINEELIDTLDQSETMQDLLLSHEKVFVPSTLKEKCSNVAICFDGTKFTCGFDGCGSSYKNARGIQKHLRKVHPYHCKSRKVKAKDLYTCLSDKHNEADKLDAEPKPSSDTNSDSPDEGLDHSIHAKCKRDHRGYSPEPSICASKRPCTEDTMLELLLRLKHLSLKNSIAHGSFPGSLQGCPSSGAKSLQSVPSSIADLNLQNEDENMPSQYLAQLAAKPFFCELQGCKYEFVTREALLMHYLKKHNYSKEKVLQLSMFQHRYSPFRCHICERSFTRKTHLRIHYKNKHQIGSDRATHRLLDSEKCDHEGPCSVDRLKGDCSAELGPNSNSETPCHSKKDECSSETDLESSCEESESKVSGISSPIGSHREEGEGREGRGSRRTVAKGNLCYILNKYHKPFHCIHKTCNSSFTNLKGLIRHYRTVHQYNKEQLCLEKDKARTKRELVKCKKLFACKYKDCNKRFLCSKALAKHCSDSHNLDHIEESKALSETESAARFSCNQPQCPAVFYSFSKLKHHLLEQHNIEGEIHSDYEIHCTLNGCGQIFSHRSNYFQHVYYRHKDSYDSLFSSQKVANERLLRSEKVCQTPEEQGQTQGQAQGQGQEQQTAKRPLNTKAKKCGGLLKDKKAPISFKTRAEAIHMCVEHSEHTQYPCMVQGCLSVVKLESSIVRHYKRTHQMNSAYLEQQLENLVVCVKYGTKIKEEPPSEVEPCVKKEENASCELVHTEHRSPGDSSVPLQNTDSTCPAEQDGGQKGCTERNLALDTDALLYRGSLKCKHTSEPTLEQCETVQSPPCKIESPIHSPCETESGPYFTDFQLPLSRIKEEPGQHSSGQENTVKNATQVPKENIRKHSQPRSFDLKTYKPMGFESSFLKFIQESEEKDDDFDDWEPSEHLPLNNSSQPANDLTGNVVANAAVNDSDPPVDIPHSSSEPPVAENLTAIAPLVVAEAAAVPSLENLRVVLDKALTDCGELALKQLHYLRPVVVLERSKFSTPILDLFPTKKTDELCVGSS
ncbi:zinc finger protein Rlf [Microtus ochrogaster]|uniref:Zinc finger protein Rlf n=1 Tax=Microtus ochrogaster TaxID=79684 RepID=A0ABM0KV24_MICOH|nr:zinc finger protein Rlf [Microtus ochrogaster]